MFKQFQTLLLAVILVAGLAACQSANTDDREAARKAVEGNTAVTPNANAAANAAATPAQPAVPTGPTTEMTFNETTFDFGTVKAGEKVSHVYEFKNTGNEPLILQDAKGSCGCTVPKWPREPIAPGETAQITVEFDSKNKNGKRNQKVTVTANTNPPQSFIYLTGEVIGDPNAQPAAPQIQVTQ